jgi:hypothetical protein
MLLPRLSVASNAGLPSFVLLSSLNSIDTLLDVYPQGKSKHCATLTKISVLGATFLSPLHPGVLLHLRQMKIHLCVMGEHGGDLAALCGASGLAAAILLGMVLSENKRT